MSAPFALTATRSALHSRDGGRAAPQPKRGSSREAVPWAVADADADADATHPLAATLRTVRFDATPAGPTAHKHRPAAAPKRGHGGGHDADPAAPVHALLLEAPGQAVDADGALAALRLAAAADAGRFHQLFCRCCRHRADEEALAADELPTLLAALGLSLADAAAADRLVTLLPFRATYPPNAPRHYQASGAGAPLGRRGWRAHTHTRTHARRAT